MTTTEHKTALAALSLLLVLEDETNYEVPEISNLINYLQKEYVS